MTNLGNMHVTPMSEHRMLEKRVDHLDLALEVSNRICDRRMAEVRRLRFWLTVAASTALLALGLALLVFFAWVQVL